MKIQTNVCRLGDPKDFGPETRSRRLPIYPR